MSVSTRFLCAWLALCSPLLPACGLDSMPSHDTEETQAELDGDSERLITSDPIVGVEIVPPSDSGQPTQQLRGLDLDAFDGTLTLVAPSHVSGVIRSADDAPATATLQWIRQTDGNTLLGRPLPTVRVAAGYDPAASLVAVGDTSYYSVILPPGTYTLLVTPDNATAPVWRREDLVVTAPAFAFDVTLEAGLSVCGVVTDASDVPLADLGVVAYGAKAGQESTHALTSADGRFCLRVNAREDDVYRVVVSPSQANAAWPVLTVEDAIAVQAGGVFRLWPTPDAEADTLLLSYTSDEPHTCYLDGTLVDAAGQPVSGARVAASLSVSGGTYTSAVTSDGQGAFSLPLLYKPATRVGSSDTRATLRIEPGADALVATTKLDDVACLEANAHLGTLTLAARQTLTGSLRDEAGLPVPGVSVIATKIPSAGESDGYTLQTLSDTDGAFSLYVDAGTYSLQVVPNPATGLARQEIVNFATSADVRLPLTLYAGLPIRGTLYDADGSPVPWAYLEAMRERRAASRSQTIGTATCDADGRFELLLTP